MKTPDFYQQIKHYSPYPHYTLGFCSQIEDNCSFQQAAWCPRIFDFGGFAFVIPLPAIGAQASWLRVCRTNFALAEVWAGGWEQEGEGKAILWYLYRLYGVTTEKDKQWCSHSPFKRLHSWVVLSSHWVKIGIFTTWKIKLLWLGNSSNNETHRGKMFPAYFTGCRIRAFSS